MSVASFRTLSFGSGSEAPTLSNSCPLGEFHAGKSLSVLQLDFFETKHAGAACHPESMRVGADDFAWGAVLGGGDDGGAMDLQQFAMQVGESGRPWIEATHAAFNHGGRLTPIDQTVFFFDQWGEGDFIFILSPRLNRILFDSPDGCQQQPNADRSELGLERGRSLIRRQYDRL